ncbi:MAG TPA: trypsin-like peptidase domain-containing protein [Solirubrobacteraceae bacterium]|nr:trypsin-like peptidase domain-containing protein [Solirubrobacteraceae bacterium]
MRSRQVAVPLVAAALGSGITAAAMVSRDDQTGPAISSQSGLLTSSPGSRFDADAVYDSVAPSVVSVSASKVAGPSAFDPQAGGDTGGQLGVSSGSGFVLDGDGRILTSAHVISGVTSVQVAFADQQRVVSAHVLGKDEESDIAVLQIDPNGLDLHPLELGDSNSVQPGDQVMAVGNPSGVRATAGTGRIAAAGQSVEAPGGYLIDDVFATDAVIEPASSGGPLLAADGRVVGITSRVAGSTSFAVPSNTIRDVLSQIEHGAKIIRPYIGLSGTATEQGLQVTDVYPDGPADRAGVQVDDLVESIDGRPVGSLTDLLSEVDRHAPGDSVTLSIMRSGTRGPVPVVLAERPATLAAG